MTGQQTSLLAILCIVIPMYSLAQDTSKRKFSATRITTAPKIDGVLSEDIWNDPISEYSGKFFQLEPNNGSEAKFNTEFRLVYDDRAIYIGIKMMDDNPELIPTELGSRDSWNKNADVIGVILDTYNKGQNAFGFFVSSAGVQSDIMFSNNNDDGAWDAVWDSQIAFTKNGWVAEIEIPYFNLRFPNVDVQKWGFNVYRVTKRLQEESSWNYINNSVDGWINQSGELDGIENVKPPVRLSLMPYVSTIYKKDGASGITKKSIAGGMDLKYGINESFTVDLTLIPDFSQVRSDNLILNLSPFEVQYDENRPFFTEGTEMFSKGNIFYSRRIGQSSRYFDESGLQVNEELSSMPGNAPLINATKVSGRTAKGLGLGIFNAITNESVAVIKNTETGEEREVRVDPFTNYNVLVLDQNMKNNSTVGVINTNVQRAGTSRDANTTFGEIRLRDSTNTWSIYLGGGYNLINEINDDGNVVSTNGHKTALSMGKVSGNLQLGYRRFVESDTWNPNDLGFNRANNNIENNFEIGYRIFKPFSIFNNIGGGIEIEHSQLYATKQFSGLDIQFEYNMQFKNFWRVGGRFAVNPTDSYDFWEPRVEGRYFRTGPRRNFNVYLSSDDRKPFRFMGYTGAWKREEDGARGNWFGLDPRYRVSDRVTISTNVGAELMKGTKGFVNFDEDDNIIFGTRDVSEITAQLNFTYTFTPMMNMSIRIRNYWSKVEYDRFHMLNEGGRLEETNYSGIDDNGESMHNANFDAFNIDVFYNWQIAPGSYFSVGYKQASNIYNNIVDKNFWNNLDSTMGTPGLTTLSARLIYFLDYSTIFGGR